MTTSPFLPQQPIGFPLLQTPDEHGSLNWPTLDASVRQTIRAILMTRKGELILARTAGVGLADFLHEPNSAITRRRLHDSIVKELNRYEKRIRLNGVTLESAGERGEELMVTINYQIKRTSTADVVSLKLNLGD